MEEIVPGIWHWSATHPKIKIFVHSYYLSQEGVLIDPIEPDEGLEWFAEIGPPTDVVLTNRHHYRSSGAFAQRFGVTVHCPRAGLHEFTHGEAVLPFDPGADLPGGLVAYSVGAICPDESALHAPEHDALAIADGAIRATSDHPLTFVPDEYMDDPERTKEGLRESYRRLEGLEFRHLLLAHGEPVVDSGREMLATFAAG